MDFSIAAILAQDGITSGAIYALLALALVLVFSVTRIIFIPQGEFVAFGALSLAAIQSGKFPHSATLLLVFGVLCLVKELLATLRNKQAINGKALAWSGAKLVLLPMLIWLLARNVAVQDWPLFAQVLLALAIVIPMGPMIYRLAYQPLAEASTLVLLIVSVGVHFALTGLGLVMFGAEGSRTTAFSDARFELGAMQISGQSLVVIAVSALLIAALYFYFERSLSGKALRATAVNRLGAQLVGIGTTQAGTPGLYPGGKPGCLVWRVDRSHDDRVLRRRFPDRLERFRRCHRWRPGQLPGSCSGCPAGWPAGIVFVFLGQRLQGGDRIYSDYPCFAVAFTEQQTP